jgi:hypothetical protein
MDLILLKLRARKKRKKWQETQGKLPYWQSELAKWQICGRMTLLRIWRPALPGRACIDPWTPSTSN